MHEFNSFMKKLSSPSGVPIIQCRDGSAPPDWLSGVDDVLHGTAEAFKRSQDVVTASELRYCNFQKGGWQIILIFFVCFLSSFSCLLCRSQEDSTASTGKTAFLQLVLLPLRDGLTLMRFSTKNGQGADKAVSDALSDSQKPSFDPLTNYRWKQEDSEMFSAKNTKE